MTSKLCLWSGSTWAIPLRRRSSQWMVVDDLKNKRMNNLAAKRPEEMRALFQLKIPSLRFLQTAAIMVHLVLQNGA